MLRETPRRSKPKASRVKHVGIVADAAAIGVDRIHLWKVLTGRRPSATLLARYRHLKSSQLKQASRRPASFAAPSQCA